MEPTQEVRGKVDPGNFRNMVSFLTRVIIERCLRGNLFAHAVGVKRRVTKGRRGNQVSLGIFGQDGGLPLHKLKRNILRWFREKKIQSPDYGRRGGA